METPLLLSSAASIAEFDYSVHYKSTLGRGLRSKACRCSPSSGQITSSTTLLGSGVAGIGTNATVKAIADIRDKEKRDLAVLNDQFANYVERVRLLEAHNKQLKMQLEALLNRPKMDLDRIRKIYNVEINEANHLIDVANKDKASSEPKNLLVQQEAEKYRKIYDDLLKNQDSNKGIIDDLNKKIAANEAEINAIKRLIDDLQDEIRRNKVETKRLVAELEGINGDIDFETTQLLNLLEEKKSFERALNELMNDHRFQMELLKNKTFVDAGIDQSEFFKSELSSAIREIRQEFDHIGATRTAEIEKWFNIQSLEIRGSYDHQTVSTSSVDVSSIQSALAQTLAEIENAKRLNADLLARISLLEKQLSDADMDAAIALKNKELSDLKQANEKLKADLEKLASMRQSLQAEIDRYRHLLEGANVDVEIGLKQVVSAIEERAKSQLSSSLFSSSSACAPAFNLNSFNSFSNFGIGN